MATDSTRGLTANEIVAIFQAWQSGALSRDSMLDIFRRGEVLPEGRTNEQEVRLIEGGRCSGKVVLVQGIESGSVSGPYFPLHVV